MTTGKLSRRAFIKTALASLALAGCASQGPPATEESLIAKLPTVLRLEPTPTPVPTVTPTPLPSADGVVQRYLSAWQNADYETMFNLLSPYSRQQISYGEMVNLYEHAFNQTTALTIETQVQSLLADGSAGNATFHSRWTTSLFDDIEADHSMKLRFEAGQWFVDWQPTLILPQLGHNITLALLEDNPSRGNIYNAPNEPLATNEQVITLGVIPDHIEDELAVISLLSEVSGLTGDEIKAEMAKAQANWFVPLADINFETNVAYHERFEALAGIERRPHPVRVYPAHDSAGHIVGTLGGINEETAASYRASGYRGDELVGLTGVERWGEPFLAGKRGGKLVTFSPTGGILAEIAKAPARPGGHVYLSIDPDLQQQAELILGQQRGAIVVMEPGGFVKAMATYPRFDPNDFATGVSAETWNGLLNDEDRPLVNRAALGTYPPASVFKIVSISAALEKLGYSPNQTFTCTGKWDGLGEEFPKKCWLESGHGVISLKDGLTQSCDVVFYEVGLALHRQDPTLLPAMARAFGLGDITGILGIEEAGGVVPDNEWKTATLGEPFFEGDAVNMAIGQGYVLTTPLQIAQMLAAVANNGILYQPQLVRQISSRDSGDQFFPPEEVGQLPVSAENLALIQEALIAVAHGSRGTAREAFKDVGFTVAGKTGTAETGIDAPHAWFAGYTPAENPQIVIAVMLENAGEGSEKAAPLFRLMAEYYYAWAGQPQA